MTVKTKLIFAYIALGIYVLISLFPFVWSGLIAFTPVNFVDEQGNKQGVDIMEWPPEFKLFPLRFFGAPPTLESFAKVFEITPFARWILNTLLYAGLVTIGHLVLDSLGGYAFARLKFPLKNFWFLLFLSTLMIPGHVTLIPVYNLMVNMDFINTYWGLFLPKLTGVFGLFLMRQFFMGIPHSLEEAAKMDGASIPRRFFTIILPISRPAMAALGIYIFLGTWNDFLWPLLITSQKEMYTLTAGLNFFRSSYYTIWQYMMAASLMITLPMVAVFLGAQKYFVESGAASGVKG
ncbi:MAG TPA: carbohydrate ABC transporter permease [Thermotogota bacterium]|nr:carbohydrate ABC transporter permease [Thermotogota bacterium]HRW93383.1 carbohydrate ABC transporter permease [Thermotogota bacterium]